MKSRTVALVVVLTAAALCHAGDATGFKRLPLEAKVPLITEAPGVAVQGGKVYYAVKDELHIHDLATGVESRRVLQFEEVATGEVDSYVLGATDTHVLVLLRHYADPDRPPVDGSKGARVGGGIEDGSLEIRSVHLADAMVDKLVSLPAEALVADRLLGSSVVYTSGTQLHFVSTGMERRSVELSDEAVCRPLIENGAAVVHCKRAVFVCRPADAEPVRVDLRRSPFAPPSGDREIHFDGRRLVANSAGRIVACELDGTEAWSFPATGLVIPGPEGILCVIDVCYGGRRVFRLDPADGRVLWKRFIPNPPGFWSGGGNSLYTAMVHDGRLITPAEHDLHVLDLNTGRTLANLLWDRKLKRGSYQVSYTLQRLAGSGNIVAMGFEESVLAIDLTPTSKVPGGQADPARGKLESVLRLGQEQDDSDAQRAFYELADTPAVLDEWRVRLEGPERSPLVRASDLVLVSVSWLESPRIAELLYAAIRRQPRDYHSADLVEMLACHAAQKTALPLLKKIAEDPGTYGEEIVKSAAFHLRISSPPARGDADTRKLLFTAGRDEAVAAFKQKLTSTDKAVRATALDALKQATEDVVLALVPVLLALQGDVEHQNAERLIAEAMQRQAAIQKVPPMLKGDRPVQPQER